MKQYVYGNPKMRFNRVQMHSRQVKKKKIEVYLGLKIKHRWH